MISKCRASHSLLVIESSDCQWLSSEPHFFWIYLNIMDHPFRSWYVDSSILTSFVFESSIDSYFPCVVSVLPDGLISSDTFASNTSYFHTDCIWTVMFIFYRGKHFFSHKSQFPSELLFLLYQTQASKPSAWMVLFFNSVAILEFCFSLTFQVFFSFSSNFVTWYICWHPGYTHAFLYTF